MKSILKSDTVWFVRNLPLILVTSFFLAWACRTARKAGIDGDRL